MSKRKLQVIITDDDPVTVFIHRTMVAQIAKGSEVKTFMNGKETLDHLLSQKHEPFVYVIFLDLNMPVMDGWEFLDAIGAKSIDDVHVVIVSSSVNKSDVDRSKEFRYVVDFWEKPVSADLFQNFMEIEMFKR